MSAYETHTDKSTTQERIPLLYRYLSTYRKYILFVVLYEHYRS